MFEYSLTFSNRIPKLGRTEKSRCNTFPFQVILPDVTDINPDNARKSIVFPEPFAPTKP